MCIYIYIYTEREIMYTNFRKICERRVFAASQQLLRLKASSLAG